MKNERQLQILRIIAQEPIETQNQLIRALRQAGIKSTQATVSRDMRELRLVKKLSEDGSYRYVCPEEPSEAPDHSGRLRTIFRESVASCCCAQNLVVVKTLPGLANAACAAIDSMEVPSMAGSLAGDDTIFLAMTDNAAAERFCEEIRALLR
ncbi:MAG: arginine repressor [Oscillospiraceae bacterium]|nr:arginine repressor [Oscillospiraceae bacterium]